MRWPGWTGSGVWAERRRFSSETKDTICETSATNSRRRRFLRREVSREMCRRKQIRILR